ncbi:MAG: hypothetical protein M3O46_10815 [Myxococcota bacterium]|nr:hypothetical protein [Myxococcota bacterium]
MSVGVSIPGAFAKTDFDNHGDLATLPTHARAGDFVDVNLGATLQFGAVGFAATGDLQQFSLTTSAAQGLSLQIGRWKGLGAWGMYDGQLVIGGGARVVTMQIVGNGRTLLTMTGIGPEAGALLMPTGRQWRVGITGRAPVRGGIFGSEDVTIDAGVRRAGPFVLPSTVVMPWEIEAGLAYQLGPRPLNPGWENPHDQEDRLRRRIENDRADRAALRDREMIATPTGRREHLRIELEAEEDDFRVIEDRELAAEVARLRRIRLARYENWPREKILLLASLLLTGPSARAVSLEGFLDQRAESVGNTVSLTPRLGVEGEPLRGRMLLRAGTYLESSRYEGGGPRQHFTFGSDVRLFPLDFWGLLPRATWKVELFVDVAPRYANGGIGIGNWH